MGSIGSSLTKRSVSPEYIPDIDDRGAIVKALFVAAHESVHDAVDGSSTGTRVPSRWGAL